MESAPQLAARFREVMLDGKWIANTNFKDRLSGLSLAQATTQIGSLNTLAKLAFHIDYYIAGLNQVFEGGPLEIRDKFSYDLPELQSQADWDQLLERMWANAEKFATLVATMSEAKLDGPFVREEYGTYRRNIEGVIEHSYYHLGQVSLIRKLVLEGGGSVPH